MTRKKSGTGAVPKPLDLEEIEEWIKERIKFYEEMRRKTRGTTREMIFEGKRDTAMRFEIKFKIIKSRIKSACEFYLRYKDKPELFVNENSEMTNDVIKNCSLKPFEITKKTYVQITSKSGWFLVNIEEYNEWLFKLAFKGVLDE